MQEPRGALLNALISQYDHLLKRLTRRLGSRGLAEDALHDTFVKLSGRDDPQPLRDPGAYIMRTALNAASDRRTTDERRRTAPDHLAVTAAVDESPDPEQVAASRSEWMLLEASLKSLPTRCQQIFLAAWVEEVPYSVLAERHQVTVRTIQTEVKKALEHCAMALGR